MKEEIISGIRNAMERGSSLEQAMQSFVNAGYNPEDVKAAGNGISEGAGDILYSKDGGNIPVASGSESGGVAGAGVKSDEKKVEVPSPPQGVSDKHVLPQLPNVSVKDAKGKKILIIGLIIFLSIAFLGALGFLIWYLVR